MQARIVLRSGFLHEINNKIFTALVIIWFAVEFYILAVICSSFCDERRENTIEIPGENYIREAPVDDLPEDAPPTYLDATKLNRQDTAIVILVESH